jgi:homoaconitase/3-isopropylmalate dehydratase large subunit
MEEIKNRCGCATYDTVLTFDAADISPMITYGTNPGNGDEGYRPYPDSRMN